MQHSHRSTVVESAIFTLSIIKSLDWRDRVTTSSAKIFICIKASICALITHWPIDRDVLGSIPRKHFCCFFFSNGDKPLCDQRNKQKHKQAKIWLWLLLELFDWCLRALSPSPQLPQQSWSLAIIKSIIPGVLLCRVWQLNDQERREEFASLICCMLRRYLYSLFGADLPPVLPWFVPFMFRFIHINFSFIVICLLNLHTLTLWSAQTKQNQLRTTRLDRSNHRSREEENNLLFMTVFEIA